MKLLFWIAQVAITLLISGVVALWIGPTYVIVSVSVLITCWALLFENAKQHSFVTKVPISSIDIAMLSGSAFTFGLIWPAIPLIVILRTFGESGGDERT